MDNEIESKIFWENAKALGIDILEYYIRAGEKIADYLLQKYGKKKSYSILCGLGGNGADGLSVAYFLYEKGVKDVNVYLVGRQTNIKNPVTKKIWDEVYMFKDEINIYQDCFADKIETSDVIIEALVGTGLEGEKLNKRFRDIVKRVSHFHSEKIALDISAPHYTPKDTISIMYPKSKKAKVIDLNFPKELDHFCGPGENKYLWKPNTKTHKNKNGHLLFFDQDSKNLKSLTTITNQYPTNSALFSFNEGEKSKILSSIKLGKQIEISDAIVFGDISETVISYATVNYILKAYPEKIFVLFGNSVNIAEIELIKENNNIVLVVSRNDLQKLLDTKSSIKNLEGKLKRFCIENSIHLILLGTTTKLYSCNGDFRMIRNKNLYKEKYKTELALKIGAYSTRNDLWMSIRAAMI